VASGIGRVVASGIGRVAPSGITGRADQRAQRRRPATSDALTAGHSPAMTLK
jgi:hypothetical protein